jgi:hypothetical protein
MNGEASVTSSLSGEPERTEKDGLVAQEQKTKKSSP